MTTLYKTHPVLDTLPELTRYRDDGCDLHPACLTCPLPHCRYDEPAEGHNVRKQVRDAAVLQVFQQEGLSAQELAQRFNVSKRTVHRILQAQRNQAVSFQRSAVSFSTPPLPNREPAAGRANPVARGRGGD